MSFERDITDFFHAKASAWVLWLCASAAAVAAWHTGHTLPVGTGLGFCLESPGTWFGNSVLSLCLSVCGVLAAGYLAITITRIFNILRTLTALAGGMFFAMQTAYPGAMATFYGGTLAVLLVPLTVFVLFTTFSDPARTRRVFLIFFLLTLAAMSQAAFMLYIPVFAIGCVQMRIFNLRTLTAGVLGIITPPWILLGLCIISPEEITVPKVVMLWRIADAGALAHIIATVAVTIITGAAFIAMNLMKILSYNSRTRAFNGFLTTAWIFTALFTLLNFNDFAFYLPLLNMLTAYQVAHFFTYRRSRRSYVAILSIIAVYAGLCIWSFI